jgi:hypothetical protein
MTRLKSKLIDTIDLLCEARHLSDAAEMACEAISGPVHSEAMMRLIGTIGDRLTLVNELLNQVKEGWDNDPA